MRANPLTTSLLAFAATVTGLGAYASHARDVGPAARPIPTARSDWRVLCWDGRIIAHFHGSFAAAHHACPRGNVLGVWDNGLGAYGFAPPFLLVPDVLAIAAPGPSRVPLLGRAARPGGALRAREAELRAGTAAGLRATCSDRTGALYDVTFLDGRRRGTDRFDCTAAGLRNGARARDVPAGSTRALAQSCPIGVNAEPAPEPSVS
jgi:hypothetical protein